MIFQIDRLRKEGNRILEEAQERLREDLKKKADLNRINIDSDSDLEEVTTAKLKVIAKHVNKLRCIARDFIVNSKGTQSQQPTSLIHDLSHLAFNKNTPFETFFCS